MSSSANWVTPSVRDVILLDKFPGREPAPHFGLVVGLFKMIFETEKGEVHARFLMVAPGTSIKPQYPLKLNIELPVQQGNGGVGKPTKFYFDNLVQIFEFPSEAIIENNKPRAQPDQASTIIGALDPSIDHIARIRRHYDGNMMNLYAKVLDRFGIDIEECLDISAKKPMSFWT